MTMPTIRECGGLLRYAALMLGALLLVLGLWLAAAPERGVTP